MLLRRHTILAVALAVSVAAGVAGAVSAAAGQAGRAAPAFPGAEWGRIADPASVGYCQPGLDKATERAKQMATTAATVVVGGRVLWDYGDQQFISYLASVRKSILAMMFGAPVESGKIRLDQTMADSED